MIGQSRLVTLLGHLGLVLGAGLMAFPVYLAVVASTHGADAFASRVPLLPGGEGYNNYAVLLGSGASSYGLPPVGRMLLNSFVMAMLIALGKIAVSLLTAFAVVYFRFPFRMLAFWTIFATLMLPVEVRILPTYEVVAGLGLLDSRAGLTLPLIASATATFLFRQVFMTVPDAMVDAARMDGAGPLRFLWSILLPLSRSSIAALFVVTFVYGWNQYLWPLLVTKDAANYTVVMGLQRLARSADFQPAWHLVMGTAVLALLPPALVVVVMQRQFVKGLTDAEK